MEWVEKNVRSDLRQATSNVVRGRDGGTDAGDRVEDVTIFIRSDKNGQDQE